MTINATSRRDLLRAASTAIAYASGAAIVGTGVAVASSAKGETIAIAPRATVTPRLARLIALHDRVEAECARFDNEVEMPARQACNEVTKKFELEAQPPHEEVTTTYKNLVGDTVKLSTSMVGSEAVARRVVSDPTWDNMGDDDWREAHRELAAAHDRRRVLLDEQLERLQKRSAEVRKRFRIDALADRAESLAQRRYQLWQAAMTTPAANLLDILAKADRIASYKLGDEDAQYAYATIMGDVRRLAGRA